MLRNIARPLEEGMQEQACYQTLKLLRTVSNANFTKSFPSPQKNLQTKQKKATEILGQMTACTKHSFKYYEIREHKITDCKQDVM